jgi:PilZ domain
MMNVIMNFYSEQKWVLDGDIGPGMKVGPDDERRQHNRNMRVMRVARLAAPDVDAEGLGMVRDVSPGGMMIDAHFELDLGQTVSIALLDDQELTGTVVWKENSMIGVSFAKEVPVEEILAKPSAKPDGKRARLPRFAMQRPVQIKIDASLIDAMLHDVSQRGAKLQCEGKLRVHNNVLVRAEGQRAVAATVKWRAGDMLGVEFHRLLPVGELEQWLKP